MTQEEKQLLIKVLCELMPYGVKVNISASKEYDNYIPSINDATIIALNFYNERCNFKEFYWDKEVVNVRPYLRPMNSMTEEELNECVCQSGIKDIECPNWQDIPKEKQFEARLNHAIAVFLTDSNDVDWLNAHHFDYRGLIPMGLALEAPEWMYNF